MVSLGYWVKNLTIVKQKGYLMYCEYCQSKMAQAGFSINEGVVCENPECPINFMHKTCPNGHSGKIWGYRTASIGEYVFDCKECNAKWNGNSFS